MPGAEAQGDLECVVIAVGTGLEAVDKCERGKRYLAGGRIHLVDVDIPEQLGTVRAHVPDLERHIPIQLLLDIQVIDLDVRRAQFLIHGKNVGCGKARWSEYTHVREDGGGTEAEGNRVGSHP